MTRAIFTLTITCLLFSSQALSVNQPYPQTEEELWEEIGKLNFQENPRIYHLAGMNQSFDLPQGWLFLEEGDAQRFMFLMNGASYDEVNAVSLNSETDDMVALTYFESGYVEDSDWSKLDPEELLEGIIEGNEEANRERLQNNVSPIHVRGWIEEPTYDTNKRTVHWIIEAEIDGTSLLNAVALKLGRHGFMQLVWVPSAEQPQNDGQNYLNFAVEQHSFDQGFAYDDFSTGDKLAGIGLASLVAATAGSKNGKGVAAGLMATLLFLAKKFWFIVLVPFVFLKKFITRSKS